MVLEPGPGRGPAAVAALGRRDRALLGLLVCLCGAALAAGCTHRAELKRSPFITPLPEGQRQAIAAPEGSSAPSPAATLEESAALQALREMQFDAGGELVRSAAEGDGASPEVNAARELVALNPRSPGARLALARAYHHERIFDLALEHYLAARELAPEDAALARDLGRLWVDAGSPELALPYLDEALAADSSDAESWSYRGIGLDQLGRYPEGEAALRRAIAVDPRRWDYFNNLGYNLLLQQRYADAAAAFESGLVLAPAHAVLQNNLGLARGLDGRPEAALEAFRKGGVEAEAWNNLGVVHRALGRIEEAAAAFERAYRLDPHSRTIARNVRETRMRLSLAVSPETPEGPGPAAAAARKEGPEEPRVSSPVSVAGRTAPTRDADGDAPPPVDGAAGLSVATAEAPAESDGASAPSKPPARAPRVVPILPVDVAAEPPAQVAEPVRVIVVAPAPVTVVKAPAPTAAAATREATAQPQRSPAGADRAARAPMRSAGASRPAPERRRAAGVPRHPSLRRDAAHTAAPAPAVRGYRLELMRSPFPDLALKAAAEFRRRTGHAARVNQSGATYMVQIGRDLTLDEARALRATAQRAGYAEARVRDAAGREVAAGAAALLTPDPSPGLS